MGPLSVLTELLQNRKRFVEEIGQGIHLSTKITSLAIASFVLLSVYGAIIGAPHSWMQVLASAFKLPLLYLLTLLVCLPTLYFLNSIFSSRQSIQHYLALLLAMTAIISVLLFSLAPITLFFLLTTSDYQFFKVLNIIIFAATGLVGMVFLDQAARLLSESDESEVQVRIPLLRTWFVLYAFVGMQLGWTLRPFFGLPGSPFELFRPRQGNIYLNLLEAIAEILGQ